jgi:UDP-3-O-[3-hydroxymyristoyl] glucosamine N-acyltransferase
VKIGNRVQIAAKSAALDDVADGEKVMGIPAMPFRDFAKREAMLKRMVRKTRS